MDLIHKTAAPLRLEVLDVLRRWIITGRLQPGARMIEREIIEMTGVSRTVIREVLRQLETEGLVDVVPNKGAIVRKLSADEARDLYAIRAVLEGLAARMFVESHSDADLKALKKELDATVKAYDSDDPERLLEVKNRFYAVLFTGARSDTLSKMLAGLHARIWRWRALGLSHPLRSTERSKQSIAGLKKLYAAVSKRDGDLAEQIARSEVTKAGEAVLRILSREKST
jgi:DNA-binding GntR family transcriptional regulator